MLVELAVGDAYGAGLEYAPPEFVAEHNTLAGYVQNPRHPELVPGRYTDDTQMTLAVAEALLAVELHGEAWTPALLADRFVDAYRRDPHPGTRGARSAPCGDVDTVALAAGSRAADLRQDVPPHLIDALENGPYGRDHLRELDTRLLAAFPSSRSS